MNKHDKLSNEVNYYISFARAFTVQAVADFSAEVLDPSLIREYLLNDERFIVVSRLHNTESFLPKAVLKKWLIYVNVHLAKNNLSQLTIKQFSFFLGSLIDSDSHNEAIEVVTEFGKEFGLINFSNYSQKYVFPIAHILSFVKARRKILFDILTYAIDHTDISFEKHAQGLLEKAFVELDSRERFVLQAREGLFGEKKRTLSEIADDLEITRERVRQIERDIYKHKFFFRPFLTILLQDIVRRRGSVLFNTLFMDMKTRTFFAKCLDIPVANVIDLDLAIIGTFQVSLDTQHPSLDIKSIIGWFNINNNFCLIDADNYFLAKSFISYWQDTSKIVDKVYVALKHIGKPAHYSMICGMYNSLFPTRPNNEKNIHSTLLREKNGIVWIGVKGMFALTEWGFKRPEKTLMKTAVDIVEQRYMQSRRPIPFDVVVSEFKKHRKIINYSSLKMSVYNNPELVLVGSDSFLPKNANVVSQRCSDGNPIINDQNNLPVSEATTNQIKKSNPFRIKMSFLDELTYREREVIKLLNGVDTTHYHSYEEIGRVFKTPITRIEEIERKAISKLRKIAQNSTQG